MPFLFRLCSVFCVLALACACATSPTKPEASGGAASMARLGDHLRNKGELEGAVNFYRRALVEEPDNGAAIKGLAAVLAQWGDVSGVANVYREGVKARPKDAELRRLYGQHFLTQDNPYEARMHFEAALALEETPKIRGSLAVALDHLGEHALAQRNYEKALEALPGDLALLNNLAYSYILARDYKRAMQILEPVADDKAATPALRQNLALAYGLAGMDADAERMSRKDLSPEKVQQNIEYYRRQRAELELSKAPYAELGSYATEEMALAQIKKLKENVDKTGGHMQAVVLPEVSAPGGTPRFAVRMLGCARPSDVTRLCATLAQSGIPCVAKGRK